MNAAMDFLTQVAAALAAPFILYLLNLLGKWLERYPLQRLSAKDVYLGRFFDFYLMHARPAFFAVVGSVLFLNLYSIGLIQATQGILFLDSIGTALAAFTLGPWWAAVMGITTNLIGSYITGAHANYQLFGIVNTALGVVWGYYAIFRRKAVTQVDLQRIWPLLKTSFVLGFIAVLVTSPVATYLLYNHLHVQDVLTGPKPSADDFQLALFNAALNWTGVPIKPVSLNGYFLFLLCQLPFNFVDKTVSALLALILLHFLFPFVRDLDAVARTMNFIKSSAGSHVAFVLVYAFGYLALERNVPGVLLYAPLVACCISFVGMAFFLPDNLDSYQSLAKNFARLTLSEEQQAIRRRLLRAACIVLVLLLAYTTFVLGVGSIFHKNTANALAVARAVFSALFIIGLFFFTSANLYFVARELRNLPDNLVEETGHGLAGACGSVALADHPTAKSAERAGGALSGVSAPKPTAP